MFYEHDDEYNPLKIILKDAVGYYNDYKDNGKYDVKHSAKRMNLKLDDNSMNKIYDIFEHIEQKLGIDLNNFTYESKGEEYLKTIESDETCFIKNNKTNIISNENTKYNSRVLLQIQPVYYNMENKDIRYYVQVLLDQCVYRPFSNNILVDPDISFTDIVVLKDIIVYD